MKKHRLDNWGKPVISTQEALEGNIFNKVTKGICVGMTEYGHIRVTEGCSISSIYHPDFWEFSYS